MNEVKLIEPCFSKLNLTLNSMNEGEHKEYINYSNSHNYEETIKFILNKSE